MILSSYEERTLGFSSFLRHFTTIHQHRINSSNTIKNFRSSEKYLNFPGRREGEGGGQKAPYSQELPQQESDHNEGETTQESEPSPPSSRAKYQLGIPATGDDTTDNDIGKFWSVALPVQKSKSDKITETKTVTATSETTTTVSSSTSSSNTDTEKVSVSYSTQQTNITTTAESSTKASTAVATASPNNKNTAISTPSKRYELGHDKNEPVEYQVATNVGSKKLIAKDREGQFLSRALWMYGDNKNQTDIIADSSSSDMVGNQYEPERLSRPSQPSLQKEEEAPLRYEDIDLSIPLSAYNPDKNIDLVWDLLRYEALLEAEREPLLVSFLYSTILNHDSLESALAFHLANRLSSGSSMMSTQTMSLILEALERSPTFCREVRADIMAVRDRDPACTCLPDVFLHFKGFHALETYRVAHFFWKFEKKKTLAHYLQSQVSQHFQIDIHPNATLGSGIMLDHGTGIIIGQTASVGHNCSILHHVTLGGSGKKGVDRHPKVGNGVLLGAGASILGNIRIGDGCQVGAGTLVLDELQPHCVAVGVPAKVIGTFRDEDVQPGRSMNQVGTKESDAMIKDFQSGEGI